MLKTKLGLKFLNHINKHITKTNPPNKIFNKNTLKIIVVRIMSRKLLKKIIIKDSTNIKIQMVWRIAMMR